MSKRLRNNYSNSNTLSTATSKRSKIFGNNFFKLINKQFNINNMMKQLGYNSNTLSTATSKITKTKKPRKQSTPKKSPQK